MCTPATGRRGISRLILVGIGLEQPADRAVTQRQETDIGVRLPVAFPMHADRDDSERSAIRRPRPRPRSCIVRKQQLRHVAAVRRLPIDLGQPVPDAEEGDPRAIRGPDWIPVVLPLHREQLLRLLVSIPHPEVGRAIGVELHHDLSPIR